MILDKSFETINKEDVMTRLIKNETIFAVDLLVVEQNNLHNTNNKSNFYMNDLSMKTIQALLERDFMLYFKRREK